MTDKFIQYRHDSQSYVVTDIVGDVHPVAGRIFWDDPHDLLAAVLREGGRVEIQ